jgi:hypothetical protein
MLHELAERLRAERHEAVLDDRTDRGEPSVRFQLRPRPGPFDPRRRTFPALEIAGTSEDDVLMVRTWLVPSDAEPASEQELPIDAPDGRIRRVLLDFVELVFSRT